MQLKLSEFIFLLLFDLVDETKENEKSRKCVDGGSVVIALCYAYKLNEQIM